MFLWIESGPIYYLLLHIPISTWEQKNLITGVCYFMAIFCWCFHTVCIATWRFGEICSTPILDTRQPWKPAHQPPQEQYLRLPCHDCDVVGLLLLFFWLPDSPKYLVATGKEEKARSILELFSRASGKALPAGKLVPTSASDTQEEHNNVALSALDQLKGYEGPSAELNWKLDGFSCSFLRCSRQFSCSHGYITTMSSLTYPGSSVRGIVWPEGLCCCLFAVCSAPHCGEWR